MSVVRFSKTSFIRRNTPHSVCGERGIATITPDSCKRCGSRMFKDEAVGRLFCRKCDDYATFETGSGWGLPP